jgi:purine-binding chemotaxis protein CheW
LRDADVTAPGSSLHQPVRACVFALGGEQLAADIRHTREVVVLTDRTAVPGAPAYVVGVANLRGNVVPIVDIGPLLGLPPHPAGEALRTIVLEAAGIQIAVPTDEVLGLESFDSVMPRDEATPSPREDLALGRLRRTDGLATLLDVPRLVETARVEAPGRSAAGRLPGDPQSTGHRPA